MPYSHRSGLLGFLLLLAALAPAAGRAATTPAEQPLNDLAQAAAPTDAGAAGLVEARLRRIALALRQRAGEPAPEAGAQPDLGAGETVSWIWGNRGGWGNGGFRNGGWGNGGWGNGGWGNGGFRNGGWGNGFLNRW